MGLDNYWVIPNPEWSGDPNSEAEGDYKYLPCTNPQWVSNELPQLVGGMFSGDGADGSFRGKVYDEFIRAVTKRTLYEEQDNESVMQMAEMLACYLIFKGRVIEAAKSRIERGGGGDFLEWGIAHAPDLFHMFYAFGRAGAHLDHWY